MAAVKNRESSRLADFKKDVETSDTAGENTSQDSGLRMRLDMALHDLETAHANLDLERQRVSCASIFFLRWLAAVSLFKTTL
jgi:hypothetical protein